MSGFRVAIIGIALFFLTGADVALGQSNRSPAAVQPVVGGAPNGRFQIVNGTPEMTRNIMLLDTVSGDSWILCTTEGAQGWCRMPRSHGTASNLTDGKSN